MRPPRLFARSAASFNAASVASTDVKTTEISSLEPISSVSGRAGTPVIGAIILSSASAMDFCPPSYESRIWGLKKSLGRDKNFMKKESAGLFNYLIPLTRYNVDRSRWKVKAYDLPSEESLAFWKKNAARSGSLRSRQVSIWPECASMRRIDAVRWPASVR